MSSSLNTNFGGILKAPDLNAIAKQIMGGFLAQGKGVNTGLELGAGDGLSITIAPGEFTAQTQDNNPAPITRQVDPNYEGWVWIQADQIKDNKPSILIQGTNADPGSTFVCLGHFVSDGDSVSVDSAGRTMFGWKIGAGMDPSEPPEDVTLQRIRLKDPESGEEADIFAKIDPDGMMALYIRREDGSEEPYQSRFSLSVGHGAPPPETWGRTNDIYLDLNNGDWWQRRNGVWVLAGNGWPDLTHFILDTDPRLTNSRAPTAHSHAIADVTGLQSALDSKASTSDPRFADARAPTAHTHTITDVTGLQAALDAKVATTDPRLSDARTPTAHTHVIAEVTGLQTALNGKASATHTHAIADVTGLQTVLDAKVGTGDSRLTDARTPLAHTHAISDITGLQTALNGKAAAGLSLLNQTFTTPLLALAATSSTIYDVAGATVGMGVTVNPRASTPLGPLLYGWVSAAGKVTVEVRALVALAAGSISIDIHCIP